MGQGGGHSGTLDGSRKLVNAPGMMQNAFREKAGGFRRKFLIYAVHEHLRFAWQSSKECGL